MGTAKEEENIWEWIRGLDGEKQTLYFAHLSRQLTVCFRAYVDDDKIGLEEKMAGMYAFNEIQHDILIRILPAKTSITPDDTEIIIEQIYRDASKNQILGAHIMAGLKWAKKIMA